MFHSSLVCNVGLVSRQSDHYVGAGLSLQFLHPVFCSGKSVLIIKNDVTCSNILIQEHIHSGFTLHLFLRNKNNTIWKKNSETNVKTFDEFQT